MNIDQITGVIPKGVRKPVIAEDLWPDPMPLPSRLLDVDPFHLDMLPTDFRRWGHDITSRMNVPLDFVGIPAMIAAASLIGKRIGIRPEEHTDWVEVANLWGVVVSPPGAMKSPAARESFFALRRFEEKAAADYERVREEYDNERWYYDERIKEARASVMRQIKAGEVDTESRAHAMDVLRLFDEPEVPAQKRFITNDATVEKLGELCRDNPMGLMVHRDEVLSLFHDLDQVEKATARAFYMSGWGGIDGYTADRIGRGTIRIPSVNLSLFGTTQPAKLTGYLRESLRSYDDGMCQRLQLLAWPDFDRPYVDNDIRRDEDARQAALNRYELLSRLHPDALECEHDHCDGDGAIPYLRFDAAAQASFRHWRATLEASIRDPDLSPALQAHFAKYRGLMPRLALVWHVASGRVGPVSLEACEIAELWIVYLTSHARRAYAALETDNTDTAVRIMRRVERGQLPIQFTARDIYRNCWSGLKDREAVERALKLLVEYDWLSATRSTTGGAPKMVFTVNPKAIKSTVH